MKKMLGAKIGFTLTAFALIISTIALVMLNTGGLAWFAFSGEVAASNLAVNVADDEGKVVDIKFFKIGKIELDTSGGTPANIYYFTTSQVSGGALNLGEHSVLVAERQMLVRFELASGIDSINISALSEASEYIIQKDLLPGVTDPTIINKNGNGISSIVQFQLVTDITTVQTSITADGGTSNVNCYKISGLLEENAKHFSDVSASGLTMTRSFSQSISISESAAGIEDAESGKKYVYLVVDYYDAAAEDVQQHVNNLILSENQDFTDVNSGESISFTCDYSFIIQ